jgi:anti-sigma factor RsiW
MAEQPGAGRLDPDTLAAYVDGQLPPEERAKVEAEIAADPETYEWVVNAVRAVEDASIVLPAEPHRLGADPEPPPAPAPGGDERPKVVPFVRRRAVIGGTGVLLATAAALLLAVRTQPSWWQELWGPSVDPRFAKLVEAVGEERYIEARLTGGFKYGPLQEVMRGTPGGHANAARLQATIAEFGTPPDRDAAPSHLHLAGVSRLLLGQLDGGAALLGRAFASRPSAVTANDLAAALLAGAQIDSATARLVVERLTPDEGEAAKGAAALAAPTAAGETARLALAVRLLEMFPRPPVEARFNLALALEALGRTEPARDAWTRFLAAEPAPEWRAEAERHLRMLEGR